MEKKLHYCPNCLEKGKIMDYFIDNNNSTKCAICQSQLKELDVSLDEWNRMKKILKNPDFMYTVKKLIELNMIEFNNTTSNSETNNTSIYTDEENLLANYGLIDNSSKNQKIDYIKDKKCPQCNCILTDEMINVNMCWECGAILDKSLADENCLLQIEQNKAYPSPARQNKPKCPTCGSTDVKHISGLNRAGSIYMFGMFSKKINKSFECNNCKFTW